MNRHRLSTLLCCLGACLAACESARAYEMVVTPVATAASRSPEQAAGMVQALQAVLRLHPAVQGKRAEVAAKQSAGESARAQRLPSLSAQWAAQKNDQSDGNPASLRLRQPLWAFGRIDSTIAVADADTQAEMADLQRVQRQLLDQTAAAYVRAWGARLRMQVGYENQSELQGLRERIRRRMGGELASTADVRLAEARLLQGRMQRDRLESEWLLAQTELEALARTPVDSSLPVPTEILSSGSSRSLADWLRLAEDAHADLSFKTQRVRVTEAEVERERLAPMPSVYLQVDRSFQTGSGANPGTTVGVVLEAALDNLGAASRGRFASALSRRDAAVADRASTLNEIQRTIRTLHLQREAQGQLRDNQARSVADLKLLLESYQRQYEAGYKSWLDVLNMQRELTEQRLAQVQAETDWLIFGLRLAALTGELDLLADLRQGNGLQNQAEETQRAGMRDE